jgi:molecular chaperone DnaK (HSP70)
MARYVFGIDFGATAARIAYVGDDGRAAIVPNTEGLNATPCAVCFSDPEMVWVGTVAWEEAMLNPEQVVINVRSRLGKEEPIISCGEKEFLPREVAALILRKLTGDAAKMLDTEVKDVVVTCPTWFVSSEKKALQDACGLAGLNLLSVIPEPAAAAIYYSTDSSWLQEGEKTILLYDLGGTTFDVSVLKWSREEIRIICSDGDHDLGGKLWDEALMGYLDQQFREETHFNGDFDAYDAQELRLKAEQAKRWLTARTEVPVRICLAGANVRVLLTRDTFEELTEHLLNMTLQLTDRCIAKAKEKGCRVEEIVLAGGASRMPRIKDALEKRYGINTRIMEPDAAVAKGAAIYGQLLEPIYPRY